MKVKVFGMLAAIQVKVISTLQEIAKPTDEGILGWLLTDGAQAVIIKACQAAWGVLVDGYERAIHFLLPLDSITVALPADHNPNEFYQTRSGLWVSEDFRSRVVAKAKPSPAGTSFKLDRATLAKNLTDSEIEVALPVAHIFSETEVCAIVVALIAEQLEGQEGTLLNNSCANLFFTASCVVGVRWFAGDRGWGVGAWTLDDCQWSAGGQVFSLATDI